jgi:hypothetical protein
MVGLSIVAVIISSLCLGSIGLLYLRLFEEEKKLKSAKDELSNALKGINSVHNSLTTHIEEMQTRLTGLEMILKGVKK